MKKILCVVFLISMLLVSCGNEKELIIDRFRDFPEEIDGCACYFSADKDDFIKGNYIYADNYEDHAYISINGLMQLFTLVKYTETAKGTWTKVYANDKYEVEVESKELWQVDQTWLQKGTIIVKSKDGKTIKKTIYGECGC